MRMISIKFDKDSLNYRSEDGKLFFTRDHLLNLPEWPASPLLELTKGELFVVPSPSTKHHRICQNLNFILQKFVREHNLGKIFAAPTDVVFSDVDVVVPDLIFIAAENSQIIMEQAIEGVPDLIVEVLSTNKIRDQVEKKNIYEEYGVKEYLIVNQYDETVEYNFLESGMYNTIAYGLKDTIKLQTISGLEIKISEIFLQ